MPAYQYDVVVIGTGPGGEGAAMQAGKHGKKVAVVERLPRIGGGCTHWGTIPSKALRFAIFQMTEVNNNRLFREAGMSAEFEFPQLRKGAEAVIRQQEDMRRGFYERNRVPLYHRAGPVRRSAHDRGRRGQRGPRSDSRPRTL